MDENFQKLKQIAKRTLKLAAKPFIIVAVVVVLILVLIAGIQYVITLDDGAYKDGDKKNVPYAVEQHTGDVTVSEDGKTTTGKTGQELWDEMIENGSRVNEYLDGPEELLKMMNAGMVTKYLDTRPNPDDPIDWKKINKDIDSNEVQGIIKLRRAYEDGSDALITYIDPETFQSYIDEYNQTGSEDAKKKALSHFTLEKGYNSSANVGTGAPITSGTVINIPAGLGSVHTYMGWQVITDPTSLQYKLREQAGMNFDEHGFGKINGRYVIACTTTFGQAGDYIDFYKEDGTVLQCIIGDIKDQNDAGCNEWGHLNGDCVVEFVVNKETWYSGGTDNPNQVGDPTELYHTEWNKKTVVKAINGGSYFDNPTFGSSTISGNTSTGGTSSSAGITSLDNFLFIGDSRYEGIESQLKNLGNNVTAVGVGSSMPKNWINPIKNGGGVVYRGNTTSSSKNTGTLPSSVNGISVMLGVNGVGNSNQVTEMKTLLNTIHKKYPNAPVFVNSVYHVGTSYTYANKDKMNQYIDSFNSNIQSFCNQNDWAYYIDISKNLNDASGYLKSEYASDGLHISTTTGVSTLVKNIKDGILSTNSTSGGSTISGDVMKWPTDGTTITSYFGLRNAPTTGASTDHGGIDIGVSTGTNVYATEAGTVTYAAMCGTAGNLVTIDHGNGYITKYMHNSAFKVSVGDKVEKGQIIALSGNTGVSTGPHLHFQIEYNGKKVDPLTFKYDNGMGDGTSGFGSNSGSVSTNSTIYAKVATWSETKTTVESDDPSVKTGTTPTHSMTTTKINYQELVSGYQLPFDYLWALLVVGQEKDFIFDLAELVYDSEIVITVHDNLTTNKNVSVDTYTKMTKVVTEAGNASVKVNYSDTTTSYDNWDTAHQHPNTTTTNGTATETNSNQLHDEIPKTYTTTTTVITKTNTLDIKLTRANVWIVDYKQDFTYETPDAVETHSSTTYPNEEYSETPDNTDNNDTAGLGEKFRQEVQAKHAAQHTTATASLESIISDYYYKTINRTVNITNTVTTKKYVSSPAKITEKIDKQSKEPNFVTLYRKHRKFGGNIESAAEWLFEILEKSDDTVDMVELTKYLLYKANGHNYGVEEYDFSVYDPENFKSLNDQYGGVSNIDGIPGQIYDFLLAKGVPPVGAAAILGNIEGESSFNPSAVNPKGCSGLCQWKDSRFDNLKTLASDKGTSWTDVQTQLEHMWNELEGSYSSVKNVIMSATEESDMEYATWYWGRYYEVYFASNNYEASKNSEEPKRRYEYAQKWYQKWKESHTGSYSGSAQLGEAARVSTDTETRIKWLYDGNDLPTSEAENNKYLETFPVEYLDKNGNRQTMQVTMHRKLKTEIQAIFKEMANAGFKVIGGNISYRQWGTDDGFRGRFPQSAHTYGHAFDVNPTQNYCIYANGEIVGDHYSPGSDPYSVTQDIVNIWKQHGFYWGGDWTSLKDYMHFSYFNH